MPASACGQNSPGSWQFPELARTLPPSICGSLRFLHLAALVIPLVLKTVPIGEALKLQTALK